MCGLFAQFWKKQYAFNMLTHEVPVLPSYRNQSIDLYSKSIDWFLYEGNTGTKWVKYIWGNEKRFEKIVIYPVLRLYNNLTRLFSLDRGSCDNILVNKFDLL